MKSRITVEIDFENNNKPIIKIAPWTSEDVRDSLVVNLKERVAKSSVLTAKFLDAKLRPDGSCVQDIILTPLDLEDIPAVISSLKDTHEYRDLYAEKMDLMPEIPLGKKGMNELAIEALEDGQDIRPFWNYLYNTFEGIQGKRFTFNDTVFNDQEVFYKHLIDVLKMMIESIHNDKTTQNA